jgi:hypothetical protein
MAKERNREAAIDEIVRAMAPHHVLGLGICGIAEVNFRLIDDDDIKALEAVAKIAIAKDPSRSATSEEAA